MSAGALVQLKALLDSDGRTPVFVVADAAGRLVVSPVVDGEAVFTGGTTSATPGTSGQVLAANAQRKRLVVQNHGTTDLYLRCGAAATVGQPSICVYARSAWELPVGMRMTGAVHLVSAAASVPFTVLEA